MTRSRTVRVAAAALVLAAFAAIGAATVSADTPAPTPGAAPPGLESLMPAPSGIQQGNASTLQERYPLLAYASFNVDALSAIGSGVQDPVGTSANVLANWWAGQLMAFVAAVAVLTIRLVEWTFSFDLAASFGAPLTAEVQALHDQVYEPLLPVALILVGIWVAWFVLARRRGLQGFQGAGWAIAALAGAGLYFAAPAAVLDAVDGFSGDLSRGILTAIGSGDPGLATRSQNPSFSQGDPADAELRMFADRYWRTFVFEPWGVAMFGDPATGQRYGEELLAKESGQPSNFDGDFNGASDQAKAWYAGRYGVDRLAIVALALAGVILASVLCLVVAGTVLTAQLALAAMAMLAPLILLVGIHPGVGRRLLIRLAEIAAGALLIRVLSAAFLAVLLVLSGLLDQVVTAVSGGWLLAAALQVVLLVTAFMYRKPFLRVFGQVASPRLAPRPGGGVSIARTAHSGLDRIGQVVQQRARQAPRTVPGGATQAAGKAVAQRAAVGAGAKGAVGAATRANPAGLALLAVEAGKLGVRWAARTAHGSAGALVVGGSGGAARPAFAGASARRLPLTRPVPLPAPARAESNGNEPKPQRPPRTRPQRPVGRTYTHHATGESVTVTSKRIILPGGWREAKP
jgi:hypothetical protein